MGYQNIGPKCMPTGNLLNSLATVWNWWRSWMSRDIRMQLKGSRCIDSQWMVTLWVVEEVFVGA